MPSWYPPEEANGLRLRAEKLVTEKKVPNLCVCLDIGTSATTSEQTINYWFVERHELGPELPRLAIKRRRFECENCFKGFTVQDVIDHYASTVIEVSKFTADTPSASEVIKRLRENLEILSTKYDETEIAKKDLEIDELKKKINNLEEEVKEAKAQIENLEAKNTNLKNEKMRVCVFLKKWMAEGDEACKVEG